MNSLKQQTKTSFPFKLKERCSNSLFPEPQNQY